MSSKNDWLDFLEHRMIMNNYLAHYGVEGMHWGVRRYQPYSTVPRKSGKSGKEVGLANSYLRKSYNRNLDKWGKSSNTNVLYITGRSGSGKSTVARKIADKNTRIVHLDTYFDDSNGVRDKELDSYLNKNLPEYRMLNAPKDQISLNDWGKICCKFEVELEKYGSYQYKRGNKVIVEGVELLDDTIRPDKSFFKDKPIAILKTNPITSSTRAMKRDNIKLNRDELSIAFDNHMMWSKDIRKFKNDIDKKKVNNHG